MINYKTRYGFILFTFLGIVFIINCTSQLPKLNDNGDFTAKTGSLNELKIIEPSSAVSLEELEKWLSLSEKNLKVNTASYSMYANDDVSGRIMFKYDRTNPNDPQYQISFEAKVTEETPLTLNLGTIAKYTPTRFIIEPTFPLDISIDSKSIDGTNDIQWYRTKTDKMVIYAYGKKDHIYTVFGIPIESINNLENTDAKLPKQLHLLPGSLFDKIDTSLSQDPSKAIPSISLEALKKIKESQLIPAQAQEPVFKLFHDTRFSHPDLWSPLNGIDISNPFKHIIVGIGDDTKPEANIYQNILFNKQDSTQYLLLMEFKMDEGNDIGRSLGIINQDYNNYVVPQVDITSGLIQNSPTLFALPDDMENLFVSGSNTGKGFNQYKVKYTNPDNGNLADGNLFAFYDDQTKTHKHVYFVLGYRTIYLPKTYKAQYTTDELNALIKNDGIISFDNLIHLNDRK